MASTDDEIRVAITANASEYNAAMADAAAKTEAFSEALRTSGANAQGGIIAQGAALERLDAAFAKSITTAKAMQEAERALDQAMATGAISAGEQAGYLAQLDEAEASMTAATTAATAAVNENTAALTVNGGVAREVGVLIGELARGNYHRLEGSTLTLANRTGLLGKAFDFLLSPAGAVTAALATVAAEAVITYNDMQTLRESLLLTNGASGQTVEGLEDIRGALEGSGATARQAQQAIAAVSNSGLFLGSSFQSAATAIVDFSQTTGNSIEKSTKVIEGLAESPTRSLAELALHFHNITPAQVEMVKNLEDGGKKAEAGAKAIDIFSQAIAQATTNLRAMGGAGSGFFAGLGSAISDLGHLGEVFQNASSAGGRLADAEKTLNNLHLEASGAIKKNADGTYSLANANLLTARSLQEVNRLLAQQAKALKEVAAENGNVAAASAKQAADTDKIDSDTKKGGNGGKGGGDEADFQQAQYDAQQQGHELSLTEQRAWWQQRLAQDKQGGESEAQAAQAAMRQLVTIQKEMDRQAEQAAKEGARQKAAAAKEASRQIVEGFQLERAEASSASLQRIQIDAQMMDRIAGLYGQNSQQYREALQQRLSDTNAYVDQVRGITEKASRDEKAINLQTLKDDHQLATQRLSIKKQEYQLQYQEGRITADKLLQLEDALAAERLKVDQNYFNAKAALDKGDVKAYEQDLYQLKAAKLRYESELLSSESSVQSKIQATWKGTANQIAGAFRTGLNSIIFQGENTKKAMAAVAESIAESIINTAVEHPKEVWLAAEALKKGVSLSTILGISTANTTGAATDIATDKTKTVALVADAVALAGAQGVASFAAAPWPVDMGAPAFGASMAAVAAGFGSVASAAGGWDRVPADDAPALLHRNEMVLPANLAERVRGMTEPGGGGGGDTHHHYHINALDTRSMRDALKRNPHLLAEAAQHARRKGF